MTHLLDSSAFFAFFFGEAGKEQVEALFHDATTSIGISALTAVELWARLKAEGHEDHFEREWQDHLPLFDVVVAADPAVCQKAIELRSVARDRVPTIDSVIAGSAALAGATLVHRDPHYAAIPASHLKQEQLPDGR